MIRQAALLTALLMLSKENISAQKVNTFSLKQSIEYALKNSPEVKNALLDIQIQKQSNKEITAIALPQLNGSVTGNHFF